MADYKDTENALDSLAKKARIPQEPAYSKSKGQVDVLDNHIQATQVQLDKLHQQMAEHLHDPKNVEAEPDPAFDGLTDQAAKLRARLNYYQGARQELFKAAPNPNSVGATLKRNLTTPMSEEDQQKTVDALNGMNLRNSLRLLGNPADPLSR